MVKISYSCLPNVRHRISAHNKDLLSHKPESDNNKDCNCRATAICPVDGKCMTESVVYQAVVQRADNNHQESYVGLTANKFKTRYNAHKSSFRHERYRHATTLSQYVWFLKENDIAHAISWKILQQARPYTPATKTCNLCNLEKFFFIIYKQSMASLNSKSELLGKCRHRSRFLLSNT